MTWIWGLGRIWLRLNPSFPHLDNTASLVGSLRADKLKALLQFRLETQTGGEESRSGVESDSLAFVSPWTAAGRGRGGLKWGSGISLKSRRKYLNISVSAGWGS